MQGRSYELTTEQNSDAKRIEKRPSDTASTMANADILLFMLFRSSLSLISNYPQKMMFYLQQQRAKETEMKLFVIIAR